MRVLRRGCVVIATVVVIGVVLSSTMSPARADDIWTPREEWDREGVDERCCVPGRKHCRGYDKARNDTFVVGESKCSRFGDEWATDNRPRLAASLLFGALSMPRYTFPSEKGVESASPFFVPTIDANVTYFPLRHFYFGGGFRWGMGGRASTTALTALAGLRLPLGTFSARAEMSAGYGAVLDMDFPDSLRSTGGWLEPRLAVDVWLGSRLTLTGFGGTVIGQDGVAVMGIGIGFHARAFDGAFVP
jgi:hypothetical protein